MSSIRRTDFLALSNLRNDGRKPHEIRRMTIELGGSINENSALVQMGLTKVLATVVGPTETSRRSDERHDRAILEVSVQSAPFSGAERRTYNAATDRRLLEASRMIERALEVAVLLEAYPKARICVYISVLQDDGGRLCAAMNAATLALMEAGIPMKDFVCACSAGQGSADNSNILVDLNRREELGQGTAYLPCAILPQRGTVVLAQCEARLPDYDTLQELMESAMEGCRAVFEYMQVAVKERAALTLAARSGLANLSTVYQ